MELERVNIRSQLDVGVPWIPVSPFLFLLLFGHNHRQQAQAVIFVCARIFLNPRQVVLPQFHSFFAGRQVREHSLLQHRRWTKNIFLGRIGGY